MNAKTFLAISLAVLCVSTGATRRRGVWNGPSKPPAAPKLEDLPTFPIDTISTKDPETKIIIFSNDTWQYYRPALAAKWADLPVYTEHWDTDQVFAYKGTEISDLPPSIELKLFDTPDDYHCPVVGHIISPYGPRSRTRNHLGVDLPLKVGDPVYAAFEGKVRYAKYNTGGFGNLVIIRHPNGLETWYAHLSRHNVQVGDYVKAGQIIGYGGSTGRSYGPHLHFEARYHDQNFDPQFLFDFEDGVPRYQTFELDRSYFNIHSHASDQLEEDIDYEFTPGTLADGGDSSAVYNRIALAQQPEQAGPKSPAVGSVKSVGASKSAAAGQAQYYTVRSGDTLGGIAIKNHTTVSQLCKLNNITPTTTLKLGRKLKVR